MITNQQRKNYIRDFGVRWKHGIWLPDYTGLSPDGNLMVPKKNNPSLAASGTRYCHGEASVENKVFSMFITSSSAAGHANSCWSMLERDVGGRTHEGTIMAS